MIFHGALRLMPGDPLLNTFKNFLTALAGKRILES